MRDIKYIVIHCSATKEGMDFKAEDIRKWHVQIGFKDICYHYVIDLDGTLEEGRPEEVIGAHVTNKNSNSIGICYIGGIDSNGRSKDTRTPAQKVVMVGLLEDLMERYPDAIILGHRDFDRVRKACPCFNAADEFRDLCKFNWKKCKDNSIRWNVVQRVKGLVYG